MNICIYGAASKVIDHKYIKITEELGEKLAMRGHGLIFGGGANGLMGAAARGFTRGGADRIVCIAPGFFNVDGVLYDKCTEYLHPETMRERKKLLEEYSDVFVITPGGIGTLDEFFEIITLRSLGRHTKPVVIFNAHHFYDSLMNMLKEYERLGFMKNPEELFYMTDSIPELIEYIENTTGEKLDVTNFKDI